MSQFIKSSAELTAFRNSARAAERAEKQERERLVRASVSGFTEAERAAAEWSRELVEVRENLARPTNQEVRGPSRRLSTGSAARLSEVHPDDEIYLSKEDEAWLREKRKKAGKENKKGSEKLQGTAKEKKKEKKDKEKKEKKDKKVKENRDLEKGAKKMAKKMRKEEKERREKDKLLDTTGVKEVPCDLSLHLAKLGAAEVADGLESEFTSCAAIDHLIQDAKLKASLAGDIDAGHAEGAASSASSAKPPAAVSLDMPMPSVAVGLPPDPLNPLEKAHDLKAYRIHLEDKAKERSDQDMTRADLVPEWDHLPYLRRSPSPCRIRTRGTMWPTRLGAWKSRAGGAYLPPTDDAPERMRRREESRSRSDSPARYAFPEEFQSRIRESRRSPSYAPEPGHRSRSLSHAPESSRASKSKRKRKKKKSSSSSRSERPSPEYKPLMTGTKADTVEWD